MEDKKIEQAFLGVIGTVVVVAVIYFLISLGSGSVNVLFNEEGFHIDAPVVDENISYEDIVSIEMHDEMDFGGRKNGFGGSNVFSGIFKNNEFGEYTLACYKNVEKFIIVELTSGDILVFNQDNVGKTLQLYDELFEKQSNI